MVTDEKAAEKPEAPPAAAAEKPPLFNLTTWIVIIGICVVEAGVFFVVGKWREGGKAAEELKELDVDYWQLGPFQVTISQDGLFHSYETKITLGMDHKTWEDEKEQKKFKAREAKIRDTILTVLQSQKWPDVMSVDGQRRLRTDLLSKLREPGVLGPESVKEICFESFSPK